MGFGVVNFNIMFRKTYRYNKTIFLICVRETYIVLVPLASGPTQCTLPYPFNNRIVTSDLLLNANKDIAVPTHSITM